MRSLHLLGALVLGVLTACDATTDYCDERPPEIPAVTASGGLAAFAASAPADSVVDVILVFRDWPGSADVEALQGLGVTITYLFQMRPWAKGVVPAGRLLEAASYERLDGLTVSTSQYAQQDCY
jgi:hypothetical protein